MVPIAQRLIRAYQSSIAYPTTRLKAIAVDESWADRSRDDFARMLQLIKSEDARETSRWLCETAEIYPSSNGLAPSSAARETRDRHPQQIALSYLDMLGSLAEAVGVRPVGDREQGDTGESRGGAQIPPAALVEALEKELGIGIVPPTVVPATGMLLERGVLNARHIKALYVATRIAALTDERDRTCEFGGSPGFVSYYLWLLGREDNTIYDTPIANVLSGWMLIGSLGHDAVVLEGERMRTRAVKVRPNWCFMEATAGHFRLTANQGSFSELSRRTFDEYVVQMVRSTSEYVLSVNDESELRAAEGLTRLHVSGSFGLHPRMKRIYRCPYWLQRGSVEELYRVTVPWRGNASSAM